MKFIYSISILLDNIWILDEIHSISAIIITIFGEKIVSMLW